MAAVGWDAYAALSRCPNSPWQGLVWRSHHSRYDATDPTGAARSGGRFNRPGTPALYTAFTQAIAIAETIRHITPETLSSLRNRRLTEMHVRLMAVIDCRDTELLGVQPNDLLHDTEYHLTQAIGAAALAIGAEGILVQSASGLGDNLVIFTTNLGTDSKIIEVRWVDPRLYVARE